MDKLNKTKKFQGRIMSYIVVVYVADRTNHMRITHNLKCFYYPPLPVLCTVRGTTSQNVISANNHRATPRHVRCTNSIFFPNSDYFPYCLLSISPSFILQFISYQCIRIAKWVYYWFYALCIGLHCFW